MDKKKMATARGKETKGQSSKAKGKWRKARDAIKKGQNVILFIVKEKACAEGARNFYYFLLQKSHILLLSHCVQVKNVLTPLKRNAPLLPPSTKRAEGGLPPLPPPFPALL